MTDLVYPAGDVLQYPRPSVNHPGPFPLSAGEMLPVIEPSGIVCGKARRDWCHGGSKLLHPVVHLHIIDRDSNIYLQKRSAGKDLYPGYWDTAVGGHVCFGETAEEALYREASEELGLTAFNPVRLETYVWETATEKEFVFVYATVGHPELFPSAEEVEEGRWFGIHELDKSLKRGMFTPVFRHEFSRIRETLEKML